MQKVAKTMLALKPNYQNRHQRKHILLKKGADFLENIAPLLSLLTKHPPPRVLTRAYRETGAAQGASGKHACSGALA